MDEALARAGHALVVDCHSFASVPLPYELDQSSERPDICLGTDAFHTPPGLADVARDAFADQGFSVAFDRPFAGALVPAAHYRRDSRVLAIMVEVNRRLYMDESTGVRLAGFDRLRYRVCHAVHRVIDAVTAGVLDEPVA